MEIVAFSDDMSDAWDEFVQSNDEAWFWHTTDWMRYSLSSQFNVQTGNVSFCVTENSRIIAIAPLIIERYMQEGEECCELRYGGWPVPVPVIDASIKPKRKNKIYKLIFNEIDRIASADNVQRAVFRIYNAYEQYRRGNIVFNFLMKYGFNDTSSVTRVIDLTSDLRDIYREFNDGTKRQIVKAEKNLSLKLYDHTNISVDIFGCFKKFYFDVAGKVTRPEACYSVLYECILKKLAVMVFAYFQGHLVGVTISAYYRSGAYYLLGASKREFIQCSVGHLMQQEMLKYMKSQGIEYYEIGHQQYGPTCYDFPTEKEINISIFKRRFGGVDVPLFTAEKFYCPNFFQACMQERIRYLTATFDGDKSCD